jgi:undecaprenyl diphosphate synthase
VTAAPVRHLAIIPDGNRRWARARGATVQAGHQAGIAAIDAAIREAFAQGVEIVTFWWGSPANLTKRAPDEVRGFVDALGAWLDGPALALLRDADARFDAHGRIDELCPELSPKVAAARAGAGAGPRRVVLLMAYDGRDELRHAADQLAKGEASSLEAGLWTADLPDVDLLLRSGDSAHLSAGFMLWRIAEARLAFVSEPWPAVTPAILRRELTAAGAQARRYGG